MANKIRPLPTKELLNELFRYEDGFIYRRNTKRKNSHGKIGYRQQRAMVYIDGEHYLVSRIIFKMHKGFDPYYCDHKDENSFNNKIDNLQSISQSKNIKKSHAHRKQNGTPMKKTKKDSNTSFYISDELLEQAKIKAGTTEHSFSKYLTILIKKDLQKSLMEERIKKDFNIE